MKSPVMMASGVVLGSKERAHNLAYGNRAREVKTTRLGDEAAPEQGGDGTDVQLHSHEREGEEGRD